MCLPQQVRLIGDALKGLHETFGDVTTRVDNGAVEIGSVVQEGEVMLGDREKVHRKEALLQAFLEKFTLPVADLANITSSPQSLDDDFFDTLIRVKGIHSDCQVLLGSESTRAGVEIMDQMTRNLNSAYQRVYLWLQRELKFLSFETPTGNHRVRKALDVLTSRPALLQSCIDTLAESRQRTLTESFNVALTGGNGRSVDKPIDLMAHDAIRYTGDMLAWLHSALVSELEALQAIFELAPGDESRGGLPDEGLESLLETETRLKDHVRPLADKSLEAVLSTFRYRTEQVISSHEEPTLLYGILNILMFYRETFKKLLGPDAVLVAAIDGLISTATRQLQSCLRDLVRSVQHDLPSATQDLSPPLFLIDALSRFKDLIKSFEASLISDEYKPQAFDMIYSEALHPYIQGCQTLSKDLPALESHIFMVNCLEVSKNTMRLSAYGTDNYIHHLDRDVDQHVAAIVDQLHDYFLTASGLAILLDTGNDEEPFDSGAVTQEILVECSQQLDEFLPSAMIDAESRLVYLSRPSLKKSVIRASLDRFVSDFARTEAALEDLPPTVFSREAFPRTTQELEILLG
ncbi:Golgi transport complex subunit 6, variant 2 [Arthrobotrys megalospora]